MTTEEKPTKRAKAKPLERITIDESLKEKLALLTQQASEALQGMATITKSDVVNFVLKSHPSQFSKNQIKELRSEHFDEVKFSQWITAQLKEAQAKGVPLSLRELINQNLNMFEGENSSGRAPRNGRAKRDASKIDGDVQVEKSITGDSGNPTTV